MVHSIPRTLKMILLIKRRGIKNPCGLYVTKDFKFVIVKCGVR